MRLRVIILLLFGLLSANGYGINVATTTAGADNAKFVPQPTLFTPFKKN
jgi:hypothetical protein